MDNKFSEFNHERLIHIQAMIVFNFLLNVVSLAVLTYIAQQVTK